MNADSIWQIARYILIAAGGYFVSKGVVDESTVTSIVGALGTIFVAVWGLIARKTPSA